MARARGRQQLPPQLLGSGLLVATGASAKGEGVMKLKDAVLDVMTRDQLREVALRFAVECSDMRSREALSTALRRSRRARVEDLLGGLSEDEVKVVCQLVGVSPVGRRGALVERLLNQAGMKTPSEPLPAVHSKLAAPTAPTGAATAPPGADAGDAPVEPSPSGFHAAPEPDAKADAVAAGPGDDTTGRPRRDVLWFFGYVDGLISVVRTRWFEGRALALVVVSLLVLFAPLADAVAESSWIEPASLGLLALLLLVLGLGRLDEFRDEEARWHLGLLWRQVRSLVEGLREGVARFAVVSWGRRLLDVGKLLLGSGLVFLAIVRLLDVAGLKTSETVSAFAEGVVLVGFFVLLFGRKIMLSEGERGGLSDDMPRLHAAIANMPTVIVCGEGEANALASSATHPLVRETLRVLATWRPRNCQLEKEYQNKLVWKLKREVVGVDVRDEVSKWGPDRRRMRFDIVLGDEGLLIEMKARLKGSKWYPVERQLREYCRNFRGPALLVVCGVDKAEANRQLGSIVDDLRPECPVVAVVVAG